MGTTPKVKGAAAAERAERAAVLKAAEEKTALRESRAAIEATQKRIKAAEKAAAAAARAADKAAAKAKEKSAFTFVNNRRAAAAAAAKAEVKAARAEVKAARAAAARAERAEDKAEVRAAKAAAAARTAAAELKVARRQQARAEEAAERRRAQDERIAKIRADRRELAKLAREKEEAKRAAAKLKAAAAETKQVGEKPTARQIADRDAQERGGKLAPRDGVSTTMQINAGSRNDWAGVFAWIYEAIKAIGAVIAKVELSGTATLAYFEIPVSGEFIASPDRNSNDFRNALMDWANNMGMWPGGVEVGPDGKKKDRSSPKGRLEPSDEPIDVEPSEIEINLAIEVSTWA